MVTCYKVHGLMVRRADAAHGSTIRLSAAFTRDSVPCSVDHIPAPNRLSPWKHLGFLKSRLLPVLESAACGFLIIFDCSDALWPLRVVSGPVGATFAVETPLGWSVIGCLSSQQVCASGSGHVLFCSAEAVLSRNSRSA